MCTTCHSNHTSALSHDEMHRMGMDHDHQHTPEKEILVEQDVLSQNNKMAERNRGYLEAKNMLALNIVSSPGSGKTTLLESIIIRLKSNIEVCVIEGDQHTHNDATRIEALHVPVIQINTQNGCHLDALMVHQALHSLHPKQNSILFIENVGNLVCPALFDLGEQLRVVVISTTEGEDKPLKYPYIFANAHVCIINKTDLLPHLKFDIEKLKQNIKKINANVRLFETSAMTGKGIESVCNYLIENVRQSK